MKNFLPIVKLACLTAAAALIVSCGDGADYRNVLPADSFVTMSVDAASLLKKSGTCDAASNPLLDRLKAELDKAEELSAEEKEYLFSLLENPAESGLDLKKELFLFMSADGADINNPEVGGGLLFPVGDKSKLDALIARINEKSGTETVTEAGVSVVKIARSRRRPVSAPITTSPACSISRPIPAESSRRRFGSCSPRSALKA